MASFAQIIEKMASENKGTLVQTNVTYACPNNEEMVHALDWNSNKFVFWLKSNEQHTVVMDEFNLDEAYFKLTGERGEVAIIIENQ